MPTDIYQNLSPKQQLELLDEVSRRTGLVTAILEKDYWVCRTLDALFQLPDLGEHLVFKGGTSLSKVYGLIDRFSEDIDISVHRDFLGFAEEDRDPESASSNKEQRRRLEALQAACVERIREDLLPALKKRFDEEFVGSGWNLRVDPVDPQTILFSYPRAGTAGPDYIRPAVRIELGARSDHWPKELHTIRSYLGDSLDEAIGVASVGVLAAERTFWEKATLLHAESHRDPDTPMPERYARHYHDLSRMARADVADRALANHELRERVVVHKTIYFRSGRARYDLAVPGSFRLVPDEGRIAELERDHVAMNQMFFTTPPPLSEVLDILRGLEARINGIKG